MARLWRFIKEFVKSFDSIQNKMFGVWFLNDVEKCGLDGITVYYIYDGH